MGLNLSNLPEKEHYSFKEIAERWGCDESTLDHYIYDLKILKVAVMESSIDSAALLPYDFMIPEAAEFILATLTRNSEGYLEATNNGLDPRGLFVDENDPLDFICGFEEKEFPKYFYLIPDYIFSEKSLEVGDSEDGMTVFIESFEGIRAYIIKTYSYTELEHRVERKYSNICFNAIYQNRFTIITKEERDRFEHKYGITSETVNVQKEVSKKTENLQLKIIQSLADIMLKNGLSDNQFTDAEKIIKKFAMANREPPCGKETLAKYLKANRL